MNIPALIELCNQSGAQLPPLPDAYVNAEYNPVKTGNANTEYPIPFMNGVPNLNPTILPFPTAARLMTTDAAPIGMIPSGTRNVVVYCNKPASIGEPLWKMLDNQSDTWMVHNGSFAVPLVITLDFGGFDLVSAIALTAAASASVLMARDFTFEGSEDGTNYTMLVSRTGESWANFERKVYATTPASYRYIRFTVTGTASGGTLFITALDFA